MSDPQPEYLIYREKRASLDTTALEQTKFIDQAVLTLGGGALGLSLTFLREIKGASANGWALHLGWICLILSIVLVLISLHSSQAAIAKYINELDEKNAEGPDAISGFAKRKYVNFGAQFTQWMNWAASALLIVGIALLAIFAYSNESVTHTEHAMSDQSSRQIQASVQPVPGQRGAVPVAPPAAPPAQSQTPAGPKK